MRRQDPEMFKLMERDRDLERECMRMGEAIRHGDSPEGGKEKIATLVKEHFEVRQAQRELRLKRLEEELAKVKSAVEKRKSQSEQIIQRRIAELIGEGDDSRF